MLQYIPVSEIIFKLRWMEFSTNNNNAWILLNRNLVLWHHSSIVISVSEKKNLVFPLQFQCSYWFSPFIVDFLVLFCFSFLDTIFHLWIDVLRSNKSQICWITSQWFLSLSNMRCFTIEVNEHQSVLLVQFTRYEVMCCGQVIL